MANESRTWVYAFPYDGGWDWVINAPPGFCVAYGSVGSDRASLTDVYIGMILLAWAHSLGAKIDKKNRPQPGISRNKTAP